MLQKQLSTPGEVISTGVAPDIHPPGYQILMFCIQRTIGNSETALRLPSAVAGILTIPVIYLLGRKLLNDSAGLLASAILAVAPIHIWFSQEARPYSILILLTAISVYLLTVILERLKTGTVLGRVNVAGFISVGILLSVMFAPVFTIRNMMVALPAIFLILSAAIHIIFSSGWLRSAISLGLCCYLLFSLFFVRRHYTEPHRHQFREVAAFVAANNNIDHETLIVASAWNVVYFNYYFEKLSSDLAVDLRAVDSSDFTEVRRMIALNEPVEVWLLWGHLEPETELIDSISALFENTECRQFLDAGVWHFR
ncbi:MAG: glycosyltransferase family 39 protein [Candidatus Sabulitectum sp.]|nr:glycosyltransferase family 39 protein [Candidatus Sabulitectum sp.]